MFIDFIPNNNRCINSEDQTTPCKDVIGKEQPSVTLKCTLCNTYLSMDGMIDVLGHVTLHTSRTTFVGWGGEGGGR